MVAKKKLLIIEVEADDGLREAIEQINIARRNINAMKKDIHLIEAASATDKIVASLDELVRALFSQAALRVNALRTIVWANPDEEEDNCVAWLHAGAKAERERMLGYEK